jgi:hypothetical protein
MSRIREVQFYIEEIGIRRQAADEMDLVVGVL